MSTIEATQKNEQPRRVSGTYIKQVWVRDNAEEVEREEFDATLHVLAMPYDQLIAVKDLDDTADAIGNAHIEWDGPHSVHIEGSICAFFGVDRMAAITPAMLNEAYAARGMNALAALEAVDIVRAWLVKRWEEYDLAKWVMEEVNERTGDPDGYESKAALEAVEDVHWQEVRDSEEFFETKRALRFDTERMFLPRMPNVTRDLIDAIADVRHEDVVKLLRSKGYHDKLPFDLLSPSHIK